MMKGERVVMVLGGGWRWIEHSERFGLQRGLSS